MSRDQFIGMGILLTALFIPVVIIYLLFFTNENIAIATMKIVITIAVLVLAGIAGWIGYTIISTPPPKPIEEIEKEIEEELKKIEHEVKRE